jgi:hypothetical protein
MGIHMPTLIVVAAGALLIYAYLRWRDSQPTLVDDLNEVLKRPEPTGVKPIDYLRDAKPIPVPPTPEELQAIAEAHRQRATGHPNATPPATSPSPTPTATAPATAGAAPTTLADQAAQLLRTIPKT